MTQKPTDYGCEVRDTIVKSSLTGVAATVLAVTIFSPSVLGGMIGTSLASASGRAPNASANNPYAHLPPYPAPLTGEELTEVETQLAHATTQIALVRADTDHNIERIRTIAMSPPGSTQVAMLSANADRVREDSAPHSFSAGVATALPTERNIAAPAIEMLPALESNANALDVLAYRGRHLELASLLLGDETY